MLHSLKSQGSGAGGRAGFSLLRLLIALAVLFLLVSGLWTLVHGRIHMRHCEANMKRIYAALELYEIDRGTLPRVAFFPDDPKQDTDSLIVALTPYEGHTPVFLCPALPDPVRERGLTYLWNTELNGRKINKSGPPEWILVELNALSEDVPPPHLGYYNILYTDGTVRRSREPPPGLREK